jgi:solute carrier family 35 protein C2
MQKSKLGLENPVDMVYHVQAWMIVAILPLAIGFEGWYLEKEFFYASSPE